MTSDRRHPPRRHEDTQRPRGPHRSQRRTQESNHFVEADPPEMVCEIHTVDGADGERLARQQAEALWEVTQWLAQNRSRRGQQQTS